MNEREKIIRLWFDMWIKKADLGIDNIFTDDPDLIFVGSIYSTSRFYDCPNSFRASHF